MLAAALAFQGAAILARFASSPGHPRPGLVFLLFLPLAGLICMAAWSLNWLLSLAAIFAVRDRDDTLGSLSSAVGLCRERFGAIVAVSSWSSAAHLVLFGGMMTVVSFPLGLAPLIKARLLIAGVTLVVLIYFAIADWLYVARLAGYVSIAEMPEALATSAPMPTLPPSGERFAPNTPVQTIDRGETILSDVPSYDIDNAPGPFYVQCDECIICGAPESVAPDLIGFYKDPSGTNARSHCYFKKQPETPAEFDRAVKAVSANCCGSYHYAGADSAVKQELRRAGCEWAIDDRE
jgi:hypothetical protein